MSRLFRYGVVAAALVAVMMPATASSMTYDKLAYLTFSAPVQVPGATLSAGTYRFHLTNPETSRSVLQVLSNDGSIVYSQFLTRPDWRASVTDNPVVTFFETPAGVDPAVRSLFYGGEERGYEFVWGRGEPNMIPLFVPEPMQPAITYAPYAVAPVAPVVESAVAAFAAAPAAAAPVAEAVVAAAAEPQAPAAELPRTASPLPLVGMGGFVSLLAGLGIGWIRRRAG